MMIGRAVPTSAATIHRDHRVRSEIDDSTCRWGCGKRSLRRMGPPWVSVGEPGCTDRAQIRTRFQAPVAKSLRLTRDWGASPSSRAGLPAPRKSCRELRQLEQGHRNKPHGDRDDELPDPERRDPEQSFGD